MNWKTSTTVITRPRPPRTRAMQDSTEIDFVERRRPARVEDTLGKRLRLAELLVETNKHLAAMESLDEALEALMNIISRETGADRATLFLNDAETGELYSRIALGDIRREIRILNTTGIAGHVFTRVEGMLIHDAYSDERFNPEVDEKTGYRTSNVLCTPIRTVTGEVIGVAQALNKKHGEFTAENLEVLQALTLQASITLHSAQFAERMHKSHKQELEFLDIVSDVTSEIDLGVVLHKVMNEAARMLNAERSTLFINDEKNSELWSQTGVGLDATQIRLPNDQGIAGTVFTSGQSVNIPYAYADLRFNPEFDRKTGFFTRSILCVPVVNKYGKTIGVTQVLNKRGGAFSEEDESRLRAFTAQVSIGLENAKLFNDVENIKNYNESMLQSMSNGVITLDEYANIVTCNAAGRRIMQLDSQNIIGQPADGFLTGTNAWVQDKIMRVAETRVPDISMDAELEFNGNKVSVNLTVLPLVSSDDNTLGTMIMIEDISTEKRVKSTMARYMDPGLADQVLEGGGDILGGKSTPATILFSDIRGFTTLTEELGAQGTVTLLNEYFTLMVDCIQHEEGMLDKFIGDAIMAAFGMPIAHNDDEDRAVRAAIAMIRNLDSWNQVRLAEGKRPVDMGIGLNTDIVVSGNIGSPKRMDYTVIGDGVNLAARLESACKQYNARILISENTYRKLRGTYRIREIDRVIVKGKTEPVSIYEVLDYHSENSFPSLMETVCHFRDGLTQYRRGNWDQAISSFRDTLKLHPEDRLSHTYIERCTHMKTHPPGDDWNGVFVMTSK
ncbi:MAG: GAF domain-containing protein [Gammaproteobacteria bacterium]|nr:GAF domain-containing protein [Gammaproteobacteria bacterium]